MTCSGCFLFSSPDPSAPPVDDPITTTGAAKEEWALEVGTGESSFVPLDDGARIAKVSGLQGGHHVPVTARVSGPNVREALVPDASRYAKVEIEITVRGAVESRSVFPYGAYGAESTADRARLEFLYLNGYVGEAVRGDAVIEVKVATPDGSQWVEASRRVVIDD